MSDTRTPSAPFDFGLEPVGHGCPTRILDNGVEETLAGDEVYESCARCGSSVTWLEDDSLDGSGYTGPICLSTFDWCQTHPIRGRETQKGAGR